LGEAGKQPEPRRGASWQTGANEVGARPRAGHADLVPAKSNRLAPCRRPGWPGPANACGRRPTLCGERACLAAAAWGGDIRERTFSRGARPTQRHTQAQQAAASQIEVEASEAVLRKNEQGRLRQRLVKRLRAVKEHYHRMLCSGFPMQPPVAHQRMRASSQMYCLMTATTSVPWQFR
jgi:hypothetical protein